MAPDRPMSSDPTILRMAAPLMVSFFMRAAFSLVDTMYAAILGDAAVAAIGLTIPFEFLMIAIWVGLSTGLTSALSRALGAREGRSVDRYLKVTWVLVWWVSPLFALVGAFIWFFAPQFGLEEDVFRSFQVYGTTLIVGSALTTFWSVIPDSVVKAHQDTRSTMWAGIWSNVINVILNTLFLFVFGWGIFGIAFSTVLGRVGGLVYAIVRARAHESRRRAEGVDTNSAVDPHPYGAILGLAVPASLSFVLMAAETAIVNTLLATRAHATEAIAAYSIFYRIWLFALNPVIAISVALLPYAARRFGFADTDGVRRGLREAGLAIAAYSLFLLGPVMLIGAPWFAAWLSESPLTQRYATFTLFLVPLACLTGAPFLMVRPVFEAMNRGRPGLVMAILRFGLLTAPALWVGMVAAQRLGQPEVYGMVAALLVVAALTSAIFLLWLRAALKARSAAEAP